MTGNSRGLLASMGDRTLIFIRYIGASCLLTGQVLRSFLAGRAHFESFLEECLFIGNRSFWTVTLVSFFMGMVLAMQAATPLRLTGSEFYVATLVALTSIREMGPLLTAFLLVGRVGSSTAAEIGTMKITDQLDALRTLGADPVDYLVLPRFLAACLMVPALTVISIAVQILGGYLIGVTSMHLTSSLYIFHAFRFVVMKDVMIGLLKALVFGMILVIIPSGEGFTVTGGARGVGRAATTAVVISLFLVIVADFFITAIFYFL